MKIVAFRFFFYFSA
ncbi:pheST operon leader peptide PheM [Providencia sneebia]